MHHSHRWKRKREIQRILREGFEEEKMAKTGILSQREGVGGLTEVFVEIVQNQILAWNCTEM